MSNWNQKFKYDLPYVFASCKEINPLYLHYLLTTKGFACPDLKNGNSLLIGCGKGTALCLHSACASSQWHGLEFSPNLTNYTKRVAKQCHIAIDLSNDDLEGFVKRTDLPKFDLICINALWSWVSKEDQEIIIDIIDQHLNEGGVVLMSYNCTVGMINYESVRDLVKLYDNTKHIKSMDDKERVVSISKFLLPIMEKNAAYIVSQPDFAERIQEAANHPKPFLSESLNTYWSMDHFSEVAKRLERADVGFVCSANAIDNLDHINLTKEQNEFLQPLLGTTLYEETRDFIVNQRLRNDLYIKGAVPLTTDEYLSELASHFVVLMSDISEFDYILEGNRGPVELDRAVYEPLLTLLSDYAPKNVGALIDAIMENIPNLNTSDLINALNTLVFSGLCSLTNNPDLISEATVDQCIRINLNTINSFNDEEPINLCSPLLQDVMTIDPLDAYMLKMVVENPQCNYLNIVEGLLTLNVQGVISINTNGNQINEDELIEYTSNLAKAFLEFTVPLYQKLMII